MRSQTVNPPKRKPGRPSRAADAKAAALAYVAEHPDATLAEVAAAAGVSRMSLYRYRDDDPAFARALDTLRQARLACLEDDVLAEIARRATPAMTPRRHSPSLPEAVLLEASKEDTPSPGGRAALRQLQPAPQ